MFSGFSFPTKNNLLTIVDDKWFLKYVEKFQVLFYLHFQINFKTTCQHHRKLLYVEKHNG